MLNDKWNGAILGTLYDFHYTCTNRISKNITTNEMLLINICTIPYVVQCTNLTYIYIFIFNLWASMPEINILYLIDIFKTMSYFTLL